MVMLKLSSYIVDINGKGPGGNWRTDQCGPHLQAPGRYIEREPSPEQLARQWAFMKLMAYIRHYATVHFVMCWSDYACKHPRVNKKGEVIILSWHTMFVSYNINRVIAGNPIQALPPGYPEQ